MQNVLEGVTGVVTQPVKGTSFSLRLELIVVMDMLGTQPFVLSREVVLFLEVVVYRVCIVQSLLRSLYSFGVSFIGRFHWIQHCM